MTAHTTVIVGTTAAPLLDDVVDSIGFADRGAISRSVVLQNRGSVAVLLGGPGVTATAYGFSLAAGQSIAFDLTPVDRLSAIVASGSAELGVLHLGV